MYSSIILFFNRKLSNTKCLIGHFFLTLSGTFILIHVLFCSTTAYIRRLSSESARDYANLRAGINRREIRRRSYRNQDNRIAYYENEFRLDRLTSLEYLELISNFFDPVRHNNEVRPKKIVFNFT